jgi:cytochrome c biogenesis protein CcmG, thiol:disulfide interchange protein DsbE
MTLGPPAELADRRQCRLASQGRLLVGALVVVAVWSSASAEQPAVTALLKRLDLVDYRAGTKPPHFTGRTVDARQLSLTELRGKVVVVNFWASWCLECRPEMPVLEGLHRELASRGLAIVGVNAREDPRAVGRYAEELHLTFPLVLDPAGKINDLYGVIGLPTTFVVARDGRAVAFAVGPRAWGSPPARALLEALLAEPIPRAP